MRQEVYIRYLFFSVSFSSFRKDASHWGQGLWILDTKREYLLFKAQIARLH